MKRLEALKNEVLELSDAKSVNTLEELSDSLRGYKVCEVRITRIDNSYFLVLLPPPWADRTLGEKHTTPRLLAKLKEMNIEDYAEEGIMD